MIQVPIMPVFKRMLICCLVLCQMYTGTTAIIDKLVEGIAVTTSQISNSVANSLPAKAATNLGTAIADEALKVVSGGHVQDASAYTTYLLFSRDIEDHAEVETRDVEMLVSAGFSVSKPTKILIHGWTNNGTDEFPVTMVKALLDAEDVNIFSVNWGRFAKHLYSFAYTAASYVGEEVASLIDFLVQDEGVDISTIHLIGYSLGAHIAGTVGENVKSGMLHRITGLDPAGPLFTSSTKDRLDPSDAKFVDVIHTTAGTVGFADSCGTVDFYPNGGHAPQPGCRPTDSSCSHGRAYLMYAESVSSKGFIAQRCASWKKYKEEECADNETAVMGYFADTSSKGVFYLKTNSERPFAMGKQN